jgi:hypothetical protein
MKAGSPEEVGGGKMVMPRAIDQSWEYLGLLGESAGMSALMVDGTKAHNTVKEQKCKERQSNGWATMGFRRPRA